MDADLSLLSGARSMNKDALLKIFDLYADPLYRYAIYSGKDAITADQIVGEVFSKFLNQVATGKGPRADIRSCLFEIAYHLISDDIRYKSHKVAIEDADLP